VLLEKKKKKGGRLSFRGSKVWSIRYGAKKQRSGGGNIVRRSGKCWVDKNRKIKVKGGGEGPNFASGGEGVDGR